jgi:hypothetical protein
MCWEILLWKERATGTRSDRPTFPRPPIQKMVGPVNLKKPGIVLLQGTLQSVLLPECLRGSRYPEPFAQEFFMRDEVASRKRSQVLVSAQPSKSSGAKGS